MSDKHQSAIPKHLLVKGAYYFGNCRNAGVARWDGTHFWYWRTKFGERFLEQICCPEDDSTFDVFVALAPFDIPLPEAAP